jgi:signal recognition particle subunit SEC65
MAKLPYSWNKVSPGDIISFIYENREGRKLRRTILVLEPKRKNLIHGIQLEISNQPTNTQIKQILEKAGTTKIVDETKKIYRVELDSNAKQTYSKMKTLIKRHGIYRTFSYDKARKSSVTLEDLRLPTQFVQELKNEN